MLQTQKFLLQVKCMCVEQGKVKRMRRTEVLEQVVNLGNLCLRAREKSILQGWKEQREDHS